MACVADPLEVLRDHRLQALQRLDAWLRREEELTHDFLRRHCGAAASAALLLAQKGIANPPRTSLGPRLPLLARPPAVFDSPPDVAEDELAEDTKQERMLSSEDFVFDTERTNEGSLAFSDEPERGAPSIMSDEGSEMQKPIAFGQKDLDCHGPPSSELDVAVPTAARLMAGGSGMLPMASQDARKSTQEKRRSRFSMRGSTANEFDMDADEEPIWFFSDLKNKDVVDSTASGVLMHTLRRQGSRHKEITHEMRARIVRASNAIVGSSTFELVSGAAIFLSAMCIGVEVEAMANDGGSSPVKMMLKDFEYGFTSFFLLELLLRVAAEHRGLCTSKQRYWILFDAFLVSSALVELVVGMLTDANSSNMMSIRIIRILRITRMIRVLRFVRVVRFVRALRVMVYSILNTLKSVVWAVILLFMVIYFFSIIFTQAAIENAVGCTECEVHGPPRLLQGSSMSSDDMVIYYWGDLGVSMLTLFGCVIGGINWDEPMQGLASIHWFWLACFLFFILFTDFAILNVVTAAFCQGAMEGQQYDREQTVKDLLSNRSSDLYKTSDLFRNMFSNLDTKGSGAISWKEFQTHIAEESVQALLALLELDNSDLFVLFRLLDVDGSDRLDAQEFVAGCMRLKGAARSIDLAKVSFENARLAKRLYSFMRFMKSEVTTLRSTVDALGGRLDSMGTVMVAATPVVPGARVSLLSNASLAFPEVSTRNSQIMADAAAARRRAMQQPPSPPPGQPVQPPPKPPKPAKGDESESDGGSQLNVRMAVV